MLFSKPSFQEDELHNVTMLKPTFFSCGCGSVTARLSSVLNFVNLSSAQLSQAKPLSNELARRWLTQEGLYEQIPLLKKHVYGVLIDNKLTDGKHKWCDVNAGTPQDVAKQFRSILNVPELNK